MDLKIQFCLKCSLACALCTILIEATLLYSSPSKPWNEKRAQSSLFFLLLRTELSWNIKTIKVKIANWRASCLHSSYIYCIEGFLRPQNKSGDSLSLSCSIPHFLPTGNVIALHPSHHLPSLLPTAPDTAVTRQMHWRGALWNCKDVNHYLPHWEENAEGSDLRAAIIKVLLWHSQHSPNTPGSLKE